jgi:predicted metal-dependent peptidase
MRLPAGVVTPVALGLAKGGIEEVYYADLASRSDAAAPMAELAGTGCGSGAGDPLADWELAADHAQAPALNVAEASMTACRRVAEAVRDYAASRGRGTLPAGLRRWAEQTLSEPTIPWQRVLPSAVRRAIAHAAGCCDYSYCRPGRRRVPRVVTPAMRRPLVTVAVVVDTSGSMGQAALEAALAEIRGVVQAAGIGSQRVLVLACDAEVGARTRVRRAEDVQLVGGGGPTCASASPPRSLPSPDRTLSLC